MVATDSDWLETTLYDLDIFINEFDEVEPTAPGSKNFLPAKNQDFPIQSRSKTLQNDTMETLKTRLMESIEKVNNDPKFIPQASQISKTVGTLINLAKIEMQLKGKI